MLKRPAPPNDRDPAPSAAELPRVSVIIITRNRRMQAEKAVASLLAGDYPAQNREIIVVEETDTPRPFCGSGVRYVAIPVRDRGFGFARNTGVSHAVFDLCAFIDDDCIADVRWLRELAGTMVSHPEAAAAGGAVRVPRCGPVGECENILGFPGGGVKYVYESRGAVMARPTFSTCNCIVRKDSLLKAGGFDERLRLGSEDETLSRCIAAASVVLYTPDAMVHHAPRDDLKKVFFWFVRRGVARAAMMRFNPQPAGVRLRQIAGTPLLRLTAAAALFAILRAAFLPVFLAIGAVYYAAMLRRYRWSRRYFPSRATLACLPLVKLVMDFGYDIGQVVGRVRKT